MVTLVVGADGLVGGHVARAFGDRELVVTTRDAAHAARRLDVTDAASFSDLIAEIRPVIVVLAAAVASAERCEEDPRESSAVNVGAAETAASAAITAGARLVVFSSEYVFPGGQGRHGEDDDVGPVNEYGRQKVALERAAAAVPGHLIVRTSGVFGRERARKNFVLRLVDQLRRGERVVVPNDQVITPTFAPDLARAVVDLLDKGVTGIVHVAGPRTVERLWFGRLVARTFGLDESRVDGRASSAIGYRAPRPLDCGLDDALLRRLLGRPLRGPEEALLDLRAAEDA